MNRQKLLLLVLLAVVLMGCSSPETVVQEIEKFEKTMVPFEDVAFIKVDFFDSPIFGMLRILSIPALIGLTWAVLKSKSTDPDFLGAVGVRFLILLLTGALSTAVIFVAFDSIGHVFWPNDLTFHYVRVSLGWTIPVLEKGSVLPALPDVFSWSLALTAVTMIPPLHQFVEIGLVIGTLITIGFAAFSGDLSGVGRMILAWMAWVVFPLMWVLVINGSRDALRSGVSPSSVAFGFWLVSWVIFALLTIAPYFVSFPTPAPAGNPAPTAKTAPAAVNSTMAAAFLGYILGSDQAGGGSGSPGNPGGPGGNAWPMGSRGSTGTPPTGLPNPRRAQIGSGGGANGNGNGQGRAASSTATDPSRGPRSNPTDSLSSPSAATKGSAAGGGSHSGTLPQPRTVRGSDKTPSVRRPFVPAVDRSISRASRGRGVTYRAKEDIHDADGRPILVRGQVVPAGEIKENKIQYGDEWISLEMLEVEGGRS